MTDSHDAAPAPRRRVVRWVMAWALGAALLVWLLRQVPWSTVVQALGAVPPWLWAACVAGLGVSYGLRAERLRREWAGWFAAAPARGRAPGFRECLALFLTHNAAVVVLPLRAGEMGYPLLLQRRFGVPLAESLKSLLWLRLQDAAVLATLALLWLPPLGVVQRVAWAVLLLVGWVLTAWQGGRALAWLASRAPRVAKFEQSWLAHRNDRAGWGLCAANWLVKLTVFAGLLQALAPLTPSAAFRGALGGELAAVLPLQGPAGLGTYEAGVWGAASLGAGFARADAGHVAAGALALHAFALVVALLAAAMIWPWAKEKAIP